jgi:ninein
MPDDCHVVTFFFFKSLHFRYESEKLQEENSILRNEITTLNEEDSISNLKLEELNGSQEELW